MDPWNVTGFVEVRELGRGGQGRVVLALHADSRTPVAIKYLNAEAGTTGREALEREATMLGRVQDPHVARLYRLVKGDHGTAIVMEAVDGVPLKAILARYEVLEPEAALLVLKGSLLGLAAAHEVGVVHRDYKPANVVVRADGLSKLIDFGIAAPAGRGSRAGTAHYMAPEQWNGEPAVPATDVYAATCVFFECVSGRRPYPRDRREAIMAGHLTADVPVEQVPEPLRGLVARGMAKDVGDRPADAAGFAAELEETAAAAYGPEWEDRGLRALALAASGLASLFPLTAAGLTQGGGFAPAVRTAAQGAKGTGTKAVVVKAVAAGVAVAAIATVAVAYAIVDRESPAAREQTVRAQPTGDPTGGASPGSGLAGSYGMPKGTIDPPATTANAADPLFKIAGYFAREENAITVTPKAGCTGPTCDLVVRGWTVLLPKERVKHDVPLRRRDDGSYRSANDLGPSLELRSFTVVDGRVTAFTLILRIAQKITVTWRATRS
ncbi:serine/threonine-protein kinase [Thermomonospora umbrina]|uniref:non-specific serine/threonine protein kinase n=1 Tax=Thermomonospora umbrina TaxID=111806 RepID=A0A3D9SSJ0_9ACTN|nr:serine/threonine-protein kinase [Thermomonospora umbrina]REE97440.1 serine/threonine protein kinase [Thermomonospora umbrina]